MYNKIKYLITKKAYQFDLFQTFHDCQIIIGKLGGFNFANYVRLCIKSASSML